MGILCRNGSGFWTPYCVRSGGRKEHSKSANENRFCIESLSQQLVRSSDVRFARASKLLFGENACWNLSAWANNGWARANILLDDVARANPVKARANKVLDASARANSSSLERTWCCLEFWMWKRKRSSEGISRRIEKPVNVKCLPLNIVPLGLKISDNFWTPKRIFGFLKYTMINKGT